MPYSAGGSVLSIMKFHKPLVRLRLRGGLGASVAPCFLA